MPVKRVPYPHGIVTFLFTDIVGSTKAARALPYQHYSLQLLLPQFDEIKRIVEKLLTANPLLHILVTGRSSVEADRVELLKDVRGLEVGAGRDLLHPTREYARKRLRTPVYTVSGHPAQSAT